MADFIRGYPRVWIFLPSLPWDGAYDLHSHPRTILEGIIITLIPSSREEIRHLRILKLKNSRANSHLWVLLRKSCDTLISDPAFVKLHLKRSALRNPHFLLITNHTTTIKGDSSNGSDDEYNKDFSVVPYSLHSLVQNPSFTLSVQPYYLIIGPCNGLICLEGGSYSFYDYQEYWLRLWNPATKEITPKFGYFQEDLFGYSRFHAYYQFNFGCDTSTDIYKVVASRYNPCQRSSNEIDLVIWHMKKFGVEDSWTPFLIISYNDLQIDYSYDGYEMEYDFNLVPLFLSEDGNTLILHSIGEAEAILYN
ncbi:hypothetical protein MTR_1g046600 [Medicago truncatula]|uniref:F-box protein interaction domain protein n=1 Tax=Medicago truncatula TaxID=3880 RepID=A0A072VIC2_MEDTR|nr:hypothetical protein MTR_1g046600 [Medicago truncatula]